jgi:flagellin
MSLRVNTNVAAINSYNNLSRTDAQTQKSLEKLSSGLRINRAADDAAGLVISESMKSQIGGVQVAQRNAQDAISVVQTGEGALNEVHSMLQRMRDLAVQAANGSNSASGIAAAGAEYDQLVSAISDIAGKTSFNGTSLLTTATSSSITFQVGANGTDTLSVSLADMSTTSLGVAQGDLGSATAANTMIAKLDDAIGAVSTQRAAFGASQNRLEHTANNLSIQNENLSAAESRIVDADMAEEMTKFSKEQILEQAGNSMLSQANSAPNQVLSLLRG